MHARHDTPTLPRHVMPRLLVGVMASTLALGGVTMLAYVKLDQAFAQSARLSSSIAHQAEVNSKLQRLLQRAPIPVHHYHIDGNPRRCVRGI